MEPNVASQKVTDSIFAQVKAAVKDPAKPFTLLFRLQVKEGTRETFEAAFAKASKATHIETGVLTYELNRDAEDATSYISYERWKSLADLEAHVRTPYITRLFGELDEMLVRAPELQVLMPAGE
jgi:quinol monooxygenase YgiN